ncbi:MAG TPA: M48 family metalloprotease [Terriglobales bacterium]|nr:M48 family metalloprotease [Terriglobales bacterium]
MMTRRLALALLAVGVAAPPLAAQSARELPLTESRDALGDQRRHYGVVRDGDPIVARVREIFDRLVRAAGRRADAAYELHVLETPKIIAEARRGGIVVVSRGFVDLTRGDVNALAWMLAHELAHLLRDHHGLLESFGALGAHITEGTPAGDQVIRTYQVMELDADRVGTLVAALAGYRVDSAIPFVTTLVEKVGQNTLHPQLAERTRTIAAQIASVIDHLDLFHLGLALTATGAPLEGAQVLEHFLTLFPSREVMVSVGVAYHRHALRYAPPREYRHALVLDSVSRAIPRGAPGPVVQQFLERAVQYYTRAAEADPAYAPVVANLAAAYLDLGEPEQALAHGARAVRLAPELPAALNNRALGYLATGDRRRAEEDLLAAARRSPLLPVVAHNLVRLYEQQGQTDAARRWAARTVGLAVDPRTVSPERIAGIAPGTSVSQLGDALAEPGARRVRVVLSSGANRELELAVLPRRALTMLVRGGVVEAVAATGPAAASAQGVRPGDPVARVVAAYGLAGGIDGVHALGLWSYPARGLAVFVANERVQSIWSRGLPRMEAR